MDGGSGATSAILVGGSRRINPLQNKIGDQLGGHVISASYVAIIW